MCIIVCVFFSLFVPCHAHSGALGSLLCGRMQSEVTHVSFFFIPVHIFSCNDGSLSLSHLLHMVVGFRFITQWLVLRFFCTTARTF